MTAFLHVPGATLCAADLERLRSTAQNDLPSWRTQPPRGVVLTADYRPSMLRGHLRAFRSVAAAEALALIGWRVWLDGGAVALLAFGAGAPLRVSPSDGPDGMARVIEGLVRAHDLAEGLALAGCFEDPPLCAALRPLEELATPGMALVVASSFETPGAELVPQLKRLARSHDLRLLHVTDTAAGSGGAALPRLRTTELDANLPPEEFAPALRLRPSRRCS